MKIAYIAHPISGDVDGNLADIRRIVPFVPYYADAVSMDDTVPSERARSGMQAEIEIAKKMGIPVINHLNL